MGVLVLCSLNYALLTFFTSLPYVLAFFTLRPTLPRRSVPGLLFEMRTSIKRGKRSSRATT